MIALITGATSGIGYEIAKILSEKNVDLVLASRNISKMKELETELKKVKVTSIEIDLSLQDSAFELYKKIKDLGIEIDILINNSGFGILGSFKSNDINKIKNMINLNILSLVLLTKLFADDMISKRKGYIMNIASTASFQPIPYFGVYAASKSFVRHFTLSLYHELKKYNVNIININPGATKTNFLKVAMDEDKPSIMKSLSAMDAKEVAELSINAMFKGKKELTTGIINKITTKLFPLVPIKLTYKIMSNNFEN